MEINTIKELEEIKLKLMSLEVKTIKKWIKEELTEFDIKKILKREIEKETKTFKKWKNDQILNRRNKRTRNGIKKIKIKSRVWKKIKKQILEKLGLECEINAISHQLIIENK